MIRSNAARDAVNFTARRTWLTLAGVTTIILSTATFAGADPITSLGTGILDAGNGTVAVTGNGSTNGCINWSTTSTPPAPCPGSGTGSLTVDYGSTSPFVDGTTGTIMDLAYNTTFPVVDFITIGSGSSELQFDLKDIRYNSGASIGSCTGSAADQPGVSCTPTTSPFTLTNGLADSSGNVDTVAVSFTVDAWGYIGSSGAPSYNLSDAYVGTFTTQQAMAGAGTVDDINTILTAIEKGQTITASWSATFTPQVAAATTPEPGSLILLGAGLMAMGFLRRYNVRKS